MFYCGTRAIGLPTFVQDELGKILFEEWFNENKTFDLSFLSAGIYVVSIESGKDIFKKKFIKIK